MGVITALLAPVTGAAPSAAPEPARVPPQQPHRPATQPVATRPATAPAAVSILPEIRADFDAGRFDVVLRKISAATDLPRSVPGAADRLALLRVRGEALLRTRQADAAARAFDDLAAGAGDRAGRAEGMATALLIRRSNAGLLYVSRRPDAQDKSRPAPPADVVDPESRRRAFNALFADELAARRRRIEVVAAGVSVRDAVGLIPVLRDLAAVEMAATGGTDAVSDLATGLDARIATHLEEAVRALVRELEGHAAYARSPAPYSPSRRRGVGGRAGRIAEIARQAGELRPACLACEDVFPATSHDFGGLGRRVEQVGDAARHLLAQE